MADLMINKSSQNKAFKISRYINNLLILICRMLIFCQFLLWIIFYSSFVLGDGGSDDQQKQPEQGLQNQSPAGLLPVGMAMVPAELMLSHGLMNMGQTAVQAPYSYLDPYYGNLIAAYYDGQQMVHPQFAGVHPGVPLPSDTVEEPVYVNAKQYHGILRRRQSRAKAESENKLIKNRKPYLHESRHLHALKRARGCGGRFLTSKKEESTSPQDQAQPSSGGTGSHGSMHCGISCHNLETNQT